MQLGKVADIEREDGPLLLGGEMELFGVAGSREPNFLGSQSVKAPFPKVCRELDLDVLVQVKTNDKRFKACGTGHGLALPPR